MMPYLQSASTKYYEVIDEYLQCESQSFEDVQVVDTRPGMESLIMAASGTATTMAAQGLYTPDLNLGNLGVPHEDAFDSSPGDGLLLDDSGLQVSYWKIAGSLEANLSYDKTSSDSRPGRS